MHVKDAFGTEQNVTL